MKTRNIISRLMSSLAAVAVIAAGAVFTSCSDDDAVTLPPVVKLDTPANNTISDITVDGATFTWERVSGAYTYTLQILLSETDTEPTAQVIVNDPLYSATVTGLEGSTTYFARIQANDELSQGKDSPFSSFIEFTTEAPEVDKEQLAAPVATLVSKTGTTLSFSWTAVANAAEYYYVLSKGSEGIATVRTTDTSVSFSDLTPGTTYSFKVMAYPAEDSEEYTFSDYSSTVVVKTVGPLATPANLASDDEAKTQTSLKFTWDAVTGAAGYAYALSTDGGTNYDTAVEIATNEVELTALTAGTSYTIKVKALAVYGSTDNSADYTDSEYSSEVTSATISASATALATPSNITVTSTASSLTITWDAVTDADSYNYKLNTAADGTGTDVKTGSVTTNSVTLSGLDASTTYYFTVQALPVSGSTTLLESAWSSWTSAATIAAGSVYTVETATAFTDALADLNAGTGGTIYVKPGTYDFNTTDISISQDITIEGMVGDLTTAHAVINARSLKVTGTNVNLVVKNIEYTGVDATGVVSSSSASYFIDINGGTAKDITVENCIVHNIYNGTLRANRAANSITGAVVFNNNIFYNIDGNNGYLVRYYNNTDTEPTSLTLTNNTFHGFGQELYQNNDGKGRKLLELPASSSFTATIQNNTFFAIASSNANLIDGGNSAAGSYTVSKNIFAFTGATKGPRLASGTIENNSINLAWTNAAGTLTNNVEEIALTVITGEIADFSTVNLRPDAASTAYANGWGDPRWY